MNWYTYAGKYVIRSYYRINFQTFDPVGVTTCSQMSDQLYTYLE